MVEIINSTTFYEILKGQTFDHDGLLHFEGKLHYVENFDDVDYDLMFDSQGRVLDGIAKWRPGSNIFLSNDKIKIKYNDSLVVKIYAVEGLNKIPQTFDFLSPTKTHMSFVSRLTNTCPSHVCWDGNDSYLSYFSEDYGIIYKSTYEKWNDFNLVAFCGGMTQESEIEFPSLNKKALRTALLNRKRPLKVESVEIPADAGSRTNEIRSVVKSIQRGLSVNKLQFVKAASTEIYGGDLYYAPLFKSVPSNLVSQFNFEFVSMSGDIVNQLNEGIRYILSNTLDTACSIYFLLSSDSDVQSKIDQLIEQGEADLKKQIILRCNEIQDCLDDACSSLSNELENIESIRLDNLFKVNFADVDENYVNKIFTLLSESSDLIPPFDLDYDRDELISEMKSIISGKITEVMNDINQDSIDTAIETAFNNITVNIAPENISYRKVTRDVGCNVSVEYKIPTLVNSSVVYQSTLDSNVSEKLKQEFKLVENKPGQFKLKSMMSLNKSRTLRKIRFTVLPCQRYCTIDGDDYAISMAKSLARVFVSKLVEGTNGTLSSDVELKTKIPRDEDLKSKVLFLHNNWMSVVYDEVASSGGIEIISSKQGHDRTYSKIYRPTPFYEFECVLKYPALTLSSDSGDSRLMNSLRSVSASNSLNTNRLIMSILDEFGIINSMESLAMRTSQNVLVPFELINDLGGFMNENVKTVIQALLSSYGTSMSTHVRQLLEEELTKPVHPGKLKRYNLTSSSYAENLPNSTENLINLEVS